MYTKKPHNHRRTLLASLVAHRSFSNKNAHTHTLQFTVLYFIEHRVLHVRYFVVEIFPRAHTQISYRILHLPVWYLQIVHVENAIVGTYFIFYSFFRS